MYRSNYFARNYFDGIWPSAAGIPGGIVYGAAEFDGISGLVVNANVAHVLLAAAAKFDGVGALRVDATLKGIIPISAAFSGIGVLNARGIIRIPARALFAASGALRVDATLKGVINANALLAGAGDLRARAILLEAIKARFDGIGDFEAEAVLKAVTAWPAEATLTGTGGFNAQAWLCAVTSAQFAGEGALLPHETVYWIAGAHFDGVGNLTVIPSGITAWPIAAQLDALSSLRVRTLVRSPLTLKPRIKLKGMIPGDIDLEGIVSVDLR